MGGRRQGHLQPTLAVASGGTAPKQALDAKYLIVPRDLRLTAMNLLYPSFAHESNIFSENMQKGQMGDVITTPSSATPTIGLPAPIRAWHRASSWPSVSAFCLRSSSRMAKPTAPFSATTRFA
jgi:hypothetical protein